MILTVTPNAALDVTYEVANLQLHDSHRVQQVSQRAGGKGINVAAVLEQMGFHALITGGVGGLTGRQIENDLDERGLRHRLSPLRGESRRTVTVVDSSGDATIFNEPGAAQEAAVGEALIADLLRQARTDRASTVVISGSLPPGLDEHWHARVVEQVRASGTTVVVDADGPALLTAAQAGADLVKPNRSELARATGRSDLLEGVQELRAAGAHDIVVSDGAEGLFSFPAQGTALQARLERTLRGNPTGAGDAAVAALCAGIDQGWPVERALRTAVAWSAAAVLQPIAGHLDPADVDALLPAVHVQEVR